MELTESFSLRWNDFEANTRVALKELREESDFCDVTLATGGKQVSAHKVVLAGGSKFFQQILKQNPHPHPLIYLKGVRYDYLLSMLDFVYTGEANINEKELKSFLDMAKDLQIKGLIEENPSRKTSAKDGETIPGNVSHQDQRSDVKKEAGPLLHTETPDVNIKVELDDTIHSTVSFGMEENRAGLKDREDVMDFKTESPNSDEIGSVFKKGQITADWCEQGDDFSDDTSRPNSGKLAPVFTSPDHFLSGVDNKVQVFSDCDMTGREPVESVSKSEDERNAHCWYEEGEKYKDVSVRHHGEPDDNHNDKELSTMKKGRKFCSICGKSVRDNSALKEHMRTHTGEKPFQCSFCPKTFGWSSQLKIHTRIHTGEKPFQCSVCFKRFTQSSSLNVHMKLCYMKLGE